MKTTAKQFTTYGNLGLVQVRIEPETSFPFKSGVQAMNEGSLLISESTGQGVVGQLRAFNKTTDYLLLTDGDVLTGAKQNRILNKSVLLKPMSETIIDVSCIERLRWHYTENNFSNPGKIADFDLRHTKAASIVVRTIDPEKDHPQVQESVWSNIKKRIIDDGLHSETESYESLLSHNLQKIKDKYPDTQPEIGCHGLAVILDKKIVSIEVFGTEEIYRQYFPKLRDSAFQLKNIKKEVTPIDVHEAYFKVLDTFDFYETSVKKDDSSHNGAGLLNIIDNERITGFELSNENQLIHCILFGK